VARSFLDRAATKRPAGGGADRWLCTVTQARAPGSWPLLAPAVPH